MSAKVWYPFVCLLAVDSRQPAGALGVSVRGLSSFFSLFLTSSFPVVAKVVAVSCCWRRRRRGWMHSSLLLLPPILHCHYQQDQSDARRVVVVVEVVAVVLLSEIKRLYFFLFQKVTSKCATLHRTAEMSPFGMLSLPGGKYCDYCLKNRLSVII